MVFEAGSGRGSCLACERKCIVSTKETKALRLLSMLPSKGKTKLAGASTLFKQQNVLSSVLLDFDQYQNADYNGKPTCVQCLQLFAPTGNIYVLARAPVPSHLLIHVLVNSFQHAHMLCSTPLATIYNPGKIHVRSRQ